MNSVNLVSVIMPMYNSRTFIDNAIRSVLEQSYAELELLLIDDCSTDSTYEYVSKKWTDDDRIHLFKLESNSGAAVARNKGIENAKGRYIAFLDSDDIWLANKLECQLSIMRETGSPFCYSAYEKVDGNGNKLGVVSVPREISYSDLLKTCVIGCLTAIYDTDYFGKIEMPLIRKRQDFGLWLRLLKTVDYAYGVQQPLAQYRVRPDSISANKVSAAKYTWKLYREVEQLGLVKSAYYFSHYAIKGLFRSKLPNIARSLRWL